VAARYSTFEPRGQGSPNDGEAFELARPSQASAGNAERPPALLVVDEHPLTAEDCAIGQVVAGKYLVEGVIGRGSMGVVVRATHLGFDELVALKFIRPEMRKLEGIVSRFAREAKASVRIRNEHAVNVLDVGVADPIGPFFVMEYLEGINLEELVDSQGAFDRATAVKYVLEACEALAAAHAQGIIHRDIKPQNMFLAWQGRLELIKILDFGISKAALSGQVFGDDLSSGEQDWVMGTPLYMSPEQLRHTHDIDERTDIWSLGAVLYELLVGQPLFSGDTQTAVCRQVFDVGQRSIRVDVPDVPDALWEVIERCLSQDREQRYANVAELGQALLPFTHPAACLHVERARALLGLERLEFVSFDEDIEEIEAIPIDDDAEPAPAVMPLETGKPVRRRPL
jgi:serine/threonine-protein kinase